MSTEEKKSGNASCTPSLSCASCGVKACRTADSDRYPGFCPTAGLDPAMMEEVLSIYRDDPMVREMSVKSACLESEFYCKLTRVEETIEFIERMGFKKVGIATCVGLLPEAAVFSKILAARNIDHYVVCCKVGAFDKTETVGVPPEKKLNGGCGHESMCNPVLQAKVLEAKGCDFNILIGLCVGHDTLFLRTTDTPTTVLIVKDRVLGHNPVQALYMAGGSYSRFKKEMGLL